MSAFLSINISPRFEPFGAGFKIDTAEVFWCRFPSIRCVAWWQQNPIVSPKRDGFSRRKLVAQRARPQPDDGDSAGDFLLAALSAKRLRRDEKALMPIPDKSASPRMMPTLQP